MKEFIIIIIILAIIIGGDIFIENYIKNTSQNMIGELKSLKNEIIASKENEENQDKLNERANDIYKKWEKTENKWAVIVLHSELDLIETSFTKMKSGIEQGELNRSLEEIETNLFLIDHIHQKEKFCLKNVL